MPRGRHIDEGNARCVYDVLQRVIMMACRCELRGLMGEGHLGELALVEVLAGQVGDVVVPSVLPLSITSTLKGKEVCWVQALRTASSIVRSRFRTGMTTEASGPSQESSNVMSLNSLAER